MIVLKRIYRQNKAQCIQNVNCQYYFKSNQINLAIFVHCHFVEMYTEYFRYYVRKYQTFLLGKGLTNLGAIKCHLIGILSGDEI